MVTCAIQKTRTGLMHLIMSETEGWVLMITPSSPSCVCTRDVIRHGWDQCAEVSAEFRVVLEQRGEFILRDGCLRIRVYITRANLDAQRPRTGMYTLRIILQSFSKEPSRWMIA